MAVMDIQETPLLVLVGQEITQRVALEDRQSRHRIMPVRTGGDDGHTRSGGMPSARRTVPARGRRVERSSGQTNKERKRQSGKRRDDQCKKEVMGVFLSTSIE